MRDDLVAICGVSGISVVLFVFGGTNDAFTGHMLKSIMFTVLWQSDQLHSFQVSQDSHNMWFTFRHRIPLWRIEI